MSANQGVLAGKRALVTGGSRGIGRAIAQAFANAGAAEVVIVFRHRKDEADRTVAELHDAGAEATAIQADLTHEDEVNDVFDQAGVGSRGEPFGIVVNNAGVMADRELAKMSAVRWNRVLDTNLTSAFFVTRRALDGMRGHGGVVVNVASVVADRPFMNQANYSAAKAGLIALTKSTAIEGSAIGVRANAVLPGAIATDMIAKVLPGIEELAATFPVPRVGAPADVAAAVLFLASDAAAYISGATLAVDGGMSLV